MCLCVCLSVSVCKRDRQTEEERRRERDGEGGREEAMKSDLETERRREQYQEFSSHGRLHPTRKTRPGILTSRVPLGFVLFSIP